MDRAFERWAVYASLGAVLGLSPVACEGGQHAPSVPMQEFAGRLAALVCDQLSTCCEPGVAYDRVLCKQRARAAFDFSQDPLLQYDPQSGGECLAAVHAALMSCTGLDRALSHGACATVYRGRSEVGEPCQSERHCVQRSGQQRVCDRPLRGEGGQCRLLEAGRLGDRCGLDERVWCRAADGLYCDPESRRCEKLGGLGKGCSEHQYGQDCAEGLVCSDGVCGLGHSIGQRCEYFEQCESGAFCDPATFRCAPQKAAGSLCELDDECIGRCRLDGRCGPAHGVSRTCWFMNQL